jgi:serine/threonine protein phosphatase PrpC
MLCPSCHTENRANARFCKGCGLPLNDKQSALTNQALPEQPVAMSAEVVPAQSADQTVPSDVSSPQAGSTPVQGINGNSSGEDISQAPTQFLTPQRMHEYHKHKWEQDLAREQQPTQATTQTQAQEQHIADQPTIHYIPPSSGALIQEQTTGQEQQPDIADFPTIATAPAWAGNEPVQTMPPVPEAGAIDSVTAQTPESLVALPQHEANKTETPEVSDVETNEPVKSTEQAASLPEKQEEAALEQTPPKPEDTDSHTTGTDLSRPTADTGDFPVLEVGARVNERYEITQVISEDEHEHTYQVTDHQGYQRCWNCASEENSEGDDFCINCGANLLDAQYIMHEYPANGATESEASVLSGVIINTFVNQDRTYVVEQPQATQIAFPNGVHLLAASDSDAGDTRRSEPNEDSTLVLQFERIHESQSVPAGIFVVADGMGGHDNGQVASRMTISQIAERFIHEMLLPSLNAENSREPVPENDEERLISLLREAIEDANTALCQVNQRDKTDMGSTLTGFMIVGDHAYIFNVGDSRTYMLRDGNLYQLTTDHSLVGQLVAGGLIEPDEVYTHPQRNQIFRSIGDKLNVQIDIFKQQVHPGDILLSCCDGLWEMVRNPQITDILSAAPDPQNACAQLIEAANTNGGEDNISAVVVYVR